MYKEIEGIRFHYDEDTDIMYITREPHRKSSYVLEINPHIRLMVDKRARNVLGLNLLDYYEYIPKFYKKKSANGKKCKDCLSQKECFAFNMVNFMKGKFEIKETKEKKPIPEVKSDIPKRIEKLPILAFACG